MNYAMVGTRADLAFTVSFLGRHFPKPTPANLALTKNAAKYLAITKNCSILYKRGENRPVVIGYCDADWGNSLDAKGRRRSTGSYVFTANGAPISWSSRKQPTVALSSTEAKYMAAKEAVKEAIWLRRFLGELGQKQVGPTVIFEDNKGCIDLSKNPVHHNQTKHIDIQYHFVRKKVKSEEVLLKYPYLSTTR